MSILGVGVGTFFSPSLYFYGWVFVCGLCFYFTQKSLEVIDFFILFFFIFIFIIFSFQTVLVDEKTQPFLKDLYEKKVVISGTIDREIDVRENKMFVVVRVKKVDNENIFVLKKQFVRVTTKYYSRLKYGDEVILSGTIKEPEDFITDTEKTFKFKGFLAKDDIYYLMSFPKIEVVSREENRSIIGVIFDVKKSFINHMNMFLPSPHSPLLAGILIGAKQSLGADILEKFRIVGLIHIVVLSGYNVSLVAFSIQKICNVFPRFISIPLSLLGIILFALLTGAGATIVRSSIMASLAIGVSIFDLKYDAGRALFLAGMIMIFQNPMIVFYDPSFQLSFMATIGLVYVSPMIEKVFLWITDVMGFREIITSTVATQIAVLPLLINMTGQVSIISLLANILVLPAIPITMLVGFCALMVSYVSVVLAYPFSVFVYALLSYQLFVVEWLSKVPFGVISI